MKFKILRDKLKKGISTSGRVTTKSASLPILKNLYMEAEDNILTLAATDLEVGIKWWSLAKIKQKGKTTVPLKVFSNFVNLLPKEKKVNIDVKNNDLSIKCEDYDTTIKGVDPEDFPIIPEVEEGSEIKITENKFFEGLNQISDVPSNTKVKPEISGVYFNFQGKTLKLAATDSYRLAEKTVFLDKKPEEDFSFILPQKAAKEILNIFENEKTVTVKYDSNQVVFETEMEETDHPKVQLSSKLIEGDYPNYKEIIPEKCSTQILLDKEEFLNKIKAASLFSGKVNEINLSIKKGNEIKIESKDSDLGNYKTEMEGKVDGDSVEISFNHRFIRDGLSEINSSEIVLGVNGSSDPGKITPVGNDDFIYVVMPIKND